MAHAEAGRPARVIIQCNAVTDPAIVRALYRRLAGGCPGACLFVGDRYEPAERSGGEPFNARQFLLDGYRSESLAADEA